MHTDYARATVDQIKIVIVVTTGVLYQSDVEGRVEFGCTLSQNLKILPWLDGLQYVDGHWQEVNGWNASSVCRYR